MTLLSTILVSSGQARAERLVVESYVGEPRDVELLMATVRSVLEKRGHLSTSSAYVSRSADQLPRAHGAPSEQTVLEFQGHLERGFRRWTDVAFADAVDAFSRALAMAREYPLLVTQSATARKDLFQAYVRLAQAYSRAGEANAERRVLEELLRCFPDQKIPFKRFGPQPERRRQQVEAELRAQGTGKLLVTTPSSDAQIFVNERFVGTGPVSLELLPGEYRVFAVTESGPSRLRVITVAPKSEQALELDTLFDEVARVEPQIALVFPDEATRADREAAYALLMAQMAGVEDGAIILSPRQMDDRGAFSGRVISASGATLREGYIAADGDAPVSHLHALAAFLDGDEPGPEVLEGTVTREGLRPRDDDGPFRFGTWKWVAMGVGAAGLAMGVTYLQLDGRGTCDDAEVCPRVYDTRDLGIVSVSLGSALLVAGAGAWFWDRRQSRRGARNTRTVSLVPSRSGWSLVLAGSF